MIGKMQDLVSAAVVFNAVDTASRGATEPKTDTAPEIVEASSGPTQQSALDMPVRSGGESQKAGVGEDADARRAKKAVENEKKLDEKAVDLMTKELNELMNKIDCNLKFKYNKDVDVMTVKMIDKSTKEVIKEFPPEEMVKSMEKTREWIGAFLDEHA